MKNFLKLSLAGVLAAAALCGPAALAQEGGQALTIGATRLLLVRNSDTLNGREMSPHDRIGHVQDVFAKHLGGKFGKFSWKKWGDRVHLYLNNDFVLAVTPADAKATGYKSSEQLAPVWLDALKKGFTNAHAGNSGGGI